MGINLSLFYFLNNLANKSIWFDSLVIFVTNYLWLISLFIFAVLYWKRGYFQPLLSKKLILFVTPVVAIGITYILKHLINSPRPVNVLSKINSLVTENGFDSFPSNHTTFMVALAVVSFVFGKRVGIIFSILALIVALSRIVAGAHFPIDIIGGTCVGLLVGLIALRLVSANDGSSLE